MMRIAVFTDNDFGKVNGVTTTLQALLRWAPPDLQIRIYTADSRGAQRPDYCSLRSIGVGLPFYREMKVYAPRMWEYVERVRRDQIDLIHLTTPGPIGLAAIVAASALRIPLVGSFHTDLARYAVLLSRRQWAGAIMTRYLRWSYGFCSRVLVPSHATAAVLDASRVAPGRHTIWRRGVDSELFTPGRRSPQLRRQWGADAGTPVVIYLGRVSREKNLAAFVAVHEQLRREGLAYRLVVVGDGPMRSELECVLPQAVFAGSIEHARVGEYLASADIFAFPSRTDTAGNVVLEAQACGLPVVVGDEGGPRENLWPGQSGLIADGRDDGSFARAVARLVGAPALRSEMAAAARQFALGRDWPSALAPLFDTYRRMIAGHSPGDAFTSEPAFQR